MHPPSPPYTQNWTVKLLFKNRRIHKQKNFKTPLPSSLLCGHHKCNASYAMTNTYRKWKMVPLLSNFWNQFTVAIIFIFMKQLTFGDHFFLHILVEEYCELLVFLFLSCFLFHLSITGVVCFLLIFSGHITSLECPYIIYIIWVFF